MANPDQAAEILECEKWGEASGVIVTLPASAAWMKTHGEKNVGAASEKSFIILENND